MGYVLRNGKRYYQDERGHLSLDNVSQEEADRRERLSSNPVFTRMTPYTGTSHNTVQGTGERIMTKCGSVPWRAIILVGIVLILVGAFFYNKNHVSSAEKAISDYMDNVKDSNGEYREGDSAEQMTDYEDTIPEVANEYEEIETYQSYILPDSAERYLDVSEIRNCSHDEIQLMINEIYARHGREFKSQDNIDYFTGLDWYDPIPGKTDEEIVQEFNKYEKANVGLLSEHL